MLEQEFYNILDDTQIEVDQQKSVLLNAVRQYLPSEKIVKFQAYNMKSPVEGEIIHAGVDYRGHVSIFLKNTKTGKKRRLSLNDIIPGE